MHLADVLDGRRSVHEPLHQAELQQQLLALVVGRRLVERAPQVTDRTLGRASAPRGQGRIPQQRHDPCLGAGRHGEQLRRDHLGRGTEVHQRSRRALVQQLSLGRGEVVVDGVAHQRVHEAERRLRPQDLRPRQGASGNRDTVLVNLGQRRDCREPGTVAQHRDGARYGDGVGRQPCQPQQHRARHRARPDLADHIGVSPVGPHAVRLQRLEQLPYEQGIAAGSRVTRGAERLLGFGPRRPRTSSATAASLSSSGCTETATGSSAISARSLEYCSDVRAAATMSTWRPSSLRSRYATKRSDA